MEQEDPTENVCCLCNNGGQLLSCDGPCRRSFHPTIESGGVEDCMTLEMEEAELEMFEGTDDPFYCPNCKHGQQQCFRCKALGSSIGNVEGPGMEQVFGCQEKNCGKFYHLRCLGLAEEQVISCPLHKCLVENCKIESTAEGGKIIPCKLCPKAWHEACLPEDISFEEGSQDQRGWRLMDMLTERETAAFVYCWDHEQTVTERGKPTYTTAIGVQFPEQAKEDQISRRLLSMARVWTCNGCYRKGNLKVELREDRHFVSCSRCEATYWVEPSVNPTKFGGKCKMITRPKFIGPKQNRK